MSEFNERIAFQVPVAFLPFGRPLVHAVTGELIVSPSLFISSLGGVQVVLNPVEGRAWVVAGSLPGGGRLVFDLGGWAALYRLLGSFVRRLGVEYALRAYCTAVRCGADLSACRRVWVSRPVA